MSLLDRFSIHSIFSGLGVLGLMLILILVSPSLSMAQQAESDTTAAEQTAPETEETTEPGQAETENKKNKQKQAEEDDDGESFFQKLMFWKKNKAPSEESSWHEKVKSYVAAKESEYYRFGYAQLDSGEWIPVFFIRRFKMMDRQYQHRLVVQGQPSRRPNIKGVRMSNYGMEVENQGFDVEMPKFASVSRKQKSIDEQEAIQLASIQLELYGFEEVIWLTDKRKDLRDLSDTWQTNGN
ncbi:MAG: hypothetical protein ACQETE_05195 [Bacteroidota bacterium]